MIKVKLITNEVWYLSDYHSLPAARIGVASSWRDGASLSVHLVTDTRDLLYNEVHYIVINPAAVAYMEEM